ncbi:hypothetical protein PG996_003320 [Apiospora saccharicola]|uniref:Uncharacterized protein n=1 Tax=Apiospora saccharicola TaxID=335842 RepID=A0ABR1W3U7_9PEZI
MDPNQDWLGLNNHPFMAMGQDGVTNGCQCGTCRAVREQAIQASKAPPKPKGPVDDTGLNNLRLCNTHPMIRHIQHQQKNGQQPRQPQQQHVNAPPPTPSPHDVSAQLVYVWPCGVTNLTFCIVDHTPNPFTAKGFPGPLFYMATLANTSKISDLIARLAPAGSNKILMARSYKGGECFDAASATCLTSLQRHAMQLEVWAKDEVDDENDGGKRVTSVSTDKTNQSNQSKKSKGKNKNHPSPARSSPSPEMLDQDEEEQEADAQMVQAAELMKRSTSSECSCDFPDTETVVHRPLDFSPHILPYFQMMGCGDDANDNHGEGPSGYGRPTIHNPKTRVGGKARKASCSSDEASHEPEYDVTDMFLP